MKYLVVDTYALSFRALYGYPELTNDKGEPTSVIIGFFKQKELLKNYVKSGIVFQ